MCRDLKLLVRVSAFARAQVLDCAPTYGDMEYSSLIILKMLLENVA